ncbi:MAG: DNA-processing protein DprA [Rhodospirillaceae bacterium]
MASSRSTDPETLASLRLIRSEGIGPVTYHGLVARFGSASKALAALPDLSKQSKRKKPFHAISQEQIEQELHQLEKVGGTLVGMNEAHYPKNLAETSDAPPFLTVLGNVGHLSRPAVAIVGARNASLNGKKIAHQLAQDLTAAGYTVWSGLARGIDTAAHSGAVARSTVAVLAGGADVLYPRENADLYERIKANGAVVSEMPPGTEPQAAYFPRRNRIISGASAGVIIVEGTPKSGSLITARFALDQGREVFAVPGSPLDPRAQGPNGLIRDGAVLVRSANDVLEELERGSENLFSTKDSVSDDTQHIEKIDEKDDETLRSEILSEISTTPVTVDELRRQCQVSAPMIAATLLDLELAGLIERLPGNRVTAVRNT